MRRWYSLLPYKYCENRGAIANFSFNLSVDSDPAVLDLVMEIMKPADSVDMYDMIIFDENTIA